MTELDLSRPDGEMRPLRQRVVAALALAGTARLLVQLLSWLMTLFVIRLLEPADYGLMGLATIFTSFVAIFNELGMGSALIQARRVTPDLLRDLFGLVIVLQLAFAAVVVAAAGPVAAFFDEPRLIPIVQIQSLLFLFQMFAIIPDALLIRRLEFKPKALVETLSALLAGVSTLLLAWLGFGAWALVDGVLIGAGARTIGLVWATRFLVWPRLRFSGLEGLVRFGGLLTAERLLWYWYSQADSLIVGKRFGDVLLGTYSVALTLASLPVDKLGPVLTQVGFPAFAELQSRPEEATAHLVKATRLLALVGCPALFGLSAVAPDFVLLLIGPQWREAILPLQLVALIMPLRLINLLVSSYLKGLGHPEASLLTMALAALLLPAAFYLGSAWGIVGIAYAWAIVFPLFFVGNLWIAGRFTPLRILAVLKALAWPTLAASLMWSVVTLLSATILDPLAPALRLMISIACGAALYAALLLLVDRRGCTELVALVRSRRQAKAA